MDNIFIAILMKNSDRPIFHLITIVSHPRPSNLMMAMHFLIIKSAKYSQRYWNISLWQRNCEARM